MSAAQPTAAATLTTPLFGGIPTDTTIPSQGTIYLYQSNNCSSPLSDTATPLIIGKCLNMPLPDIASVEIDTLPTCADSGTALLLVSDQLDCKSSTHGTAPDNGETLKCLTFGGGEVEVNLGSVMFECYGDGIPSAVPSAAGTGAPSSVAPTETVYYSVPTDSGNGDGSSSSSNSSSTCEDCGMCCCGCWAWFGIIAVLIAIGACSS